MKITQLAIEKLAPNTGQIPGVPANPRTWTSAEVEKLAHSLRETPELFEARPIIVYPLKKVYVIIGGNMRYEGAKFNNDTTVPCIVLPKEMPADKLKEIIIKDNGSFGQWNVEELASMWKDLPLTGWGIEHSFVQAHNWDEFTRISDEDKPDDPALYYRITLKVPGVFSQSKDNIITRIREVLNEYEGIQIGSNK